MKTTPVSWTLTTTITTSRNTSTFRRTISPNNYIEISVDDLNQTGTLPFISADRDHLNSPGSTSRQRPVHSLNPSVRLIILVSFFIAPDGRKQIEKIRATVVIDGIMK